MSSSVFRISLFILMFSQLQFPLVFSIYVNVYEEAYSKCSASFSCGNFTDIGYPFWSNDQPDYCGHPGFKLDCQGDTATIDINSQKYDIVEIYHESQILKIAKADFMSNICLINFINSTLDFNLFEYTFSDQNASLLYYCDHLTEHHQPRIQKFTCPINNRSIDCSFSAPAISSYDELTSRCKISLLIPVLALAVEGFTIHSWSIDQVIKEGFEVKWIIDHGPCNDCLISGGKCGYNGTTNDFTCFCPYRPSPRTCFRTQPPANSAAANPSTAPGNGANLKLKVAIGVGAAFGGMGIMAAIFLIYLRRKKNKHSASTLLFRNTSSEPSSKVDLEKGGNYHGVQVFSYGELEEATNYFDSARELGDGGFGTVYYGELQDGRAVAVKRLYENNYKRVEQFMNEVDILARLRHKNLVSLYGCTSRHSRELLLVYEFISNGTVADHLHGERAKPGALPWPTRLKIAIETASALTYLHASDIIHRDVKTNNILLDNNFCVKVADFGLSRLFPNHVTHVSTAPQGTPGYVDPEYHQCYQLTDKSDVFSFGVVLIELISSMPAVDITRHRHEINLSNLAINKIQNKALHELVDQTLGYESDNKVRRTINAVAELAFQCLQSEKDLRPYMVDVLDALRDIESDGYDDKKTHEEMMTQSPDSVTLSWTSTKTTPTSSS
ncbi:LEAF RUST 10 DISEASE-RESISTANCE LOCUS RECEPTOR-LIKE PROTEIN KINASE-like 1.2 isoform X2 [Citrus sinensis]|uniref:LEAF RUST 10 DISEASE-RESISTANCE LOCUS RECEPTOR-LIKE PROTEIN KINASE-like 1.2 isoform X2 n=1 Tax=Citrus sinensis TaxID=2711 RepID=UPI0022776688|nr:LEAF RUST 10 DISEASE-RESISTANCE LOCUS RECEPTOR-LIKE PROTEIN KINASE-like 1.2 isoform X2 [Citrus sinensis]